MTGVPISSQVHALLVLTLLGVWPYTRLVHVFSAPLGYHAWQVPAPPLARKRAFSIPETRRHP